MAVQEIVRTAESAKDVDQPLPLPAGVSDLAVGVTAGPEPNIVWVASIVVALVGYGSLLRRRRRTGARGMKTRLAFATIAILIAWGLKRHYADARPDDLSWILSPTARLVSVTTGETFMMQSGEGYFSRDRLFLIEKSCAGSISWTPRSPCWSWRCFIVWNPESRRCACWASLLASYSAAVLVNAVRISIAMWLASHPAAQSTFSAADVHRVEDHGIRGAGAALRGRPAFRPPSGRVTPGRRSASAKAAS